jgi:hypothetical protein
MFVEWFMREKLPSVVEEARTPANVESVDDALLYIADSLDKFHIYQGHRVRVLNQSTYFSHLENLMAKICLSTMSNCIWCIWVIDWKMKFEAQRFREASTHHYGKRGIGWHGVIVVYYTYEAPCEKNKFKARAVRHQVALDQILGNGNKQDGFAVLSNMEAAMAQISHEIPHLKQARVWSDNAGCYHKKELVLGIPLLNVMSAGIKILSIIHTETQDGKGLADGHFSVAFKHVVEYLITRLMNAFRKVCTPSALTDALASKNGLNNSGVQLNYIDRVKQEQLEKILSSIAAQAGEYFSRANEYLFNPDADDKAAWAQLDLSQVENWAAISFEIRVRAYSRIGSGARFQVNFEEGSFTHIPDEGDTPVVVPMDGPAEPTVPSSFANLNEEESIYEEEEDDHYIVNEFSIEDIDDLNDSDDETGEAEETEETPDELEEGDEGSDEEERLYGKPEYKPTVTGVLVSKRLTFGVIRGKEEAMERILKQAAEKDDDQNPERSVVARAIAMASESMGSETSTIRDGKADMPEYDLANGYTLPDATWHRDQGWARRPGRDGGMYGKSYLTDTYKADIQEMFERGSQTSSEKMSAAEMREELEAKSPGLYRYPGEHEIASYISSLFQAEKKNGTASRGRRERKIPEEIEEKIRALMVQNPHTTGSPIEKLLVESYGGACGLPTNYPGRKHIMEKVNAWNQAAKNKAKTAKKRSLIG